MRAYTQVPLDAHGSAQFLLCSECGAVVTRPTIDTHDAHHEALREVLRAFRDQSEVTSAAVTWLLRKFDAE